MNIKHEGFRRMYRVIMVGFCIILTIGSGLFVDAPAAHASGSWGNTTIGFTSEDFNAAYGNGTWVLIGTGVVDTSSDNGASWTAPLTVASGTTWNGVVYGGSQWVIVGSGGGIQTSSDPTKPWTPQTSPAGTGDLWNVVYGGGQFVAVGTSGTIITSSDGVSWIKRTVSPTADFFGVAYGNGEYVAVGAGGAIYTSPDGINWTERATNATNTGLDLNNVAYHGNRFVAAGGINGGSGAIVTSTDDGMTWTSTPNTAPLYGVDFAGYKWVVAGNNSTILSSTDGVNWIPETAPASPTYYNWVKYGGSFLMAGGEATGKVATQAISKVATLSGLTVNAGTLSPGFSSSTTSYTASVPYTTTSIKVTPTLTDSNGSVQVNGSSTANGSASSSISLNVGANTISIVVTAPDGITTNTYTVNVTRAAPSTNANLGGLTLSSGTLNPTFASSTTGYTATVGNTVSSLTVTPTVADSSATIKVNGASVTNGSASAPVSLNVGTNTITVLVTAQDGTTTKTYTLNVTRQSNNADLSNLSLSSVPLDQTFASGTTSYTASVGYAVNSTAVTPTLSDGTATVTVNGAPVSNGSASASVSLNVGSNTITVLVTAQDGTTTKTYTVTVTRAAAATNANLSGLAISPGTMDQTFVSGTTSYTASEGYAVNSITVTPTVSDGTATVTVDGTTVSNGSASAPISLNVGTNTITVLVTAQDGATTKTYTVTVTRAAASTNADLSNLSISPYTLDQTFASGTTSYTASVGNAVSSLTVTPTLADSTATVKVNGVSVTSGSASAPISLNVGTNTITVLVTAQDGTTANTYTITVTRAQSSNADLANLILSAGTLAPSFASSTIGYTANVGNAVSSLTVTPTLADSTATVTVNGASATNDSASAPVSLNVGTNTITVLVTAQDGTTTKTYTVTVTRLSNNADLSNLSISSGPMDQTFASSTTSYTASVGNAVSSLTVTPTLADTTATITVNGTSVTNGSASAPVSLNVGSNTITVLVTAQDGTTNTYTITVTRAQSSNAELANLILGAGTLTPTFASSTIGYTASVSNAVSSLTVTPTLADNTATVTVNGTSVANGSASAPVSLNVGSNTITVLVTAQDGTTKTYTITVTRAQSSNADLANLTLSAGTLTQTFASGTTSYTASVGNAVSSLTVTPTLADTTATVTVNGTSVTNGSASAPVSLNVGSNTITVLITAQDGTTKTYTVTVTRLSNNADLSNLSISSGPMDQTFVTATTSYTASVANAVSILTVTPTVADNTATVTVNGTSVPGGGANAMVGLNVGANPITVLVTAQDGTTKTYTVTVTRAPSSNADLAHLTLSSGPLDQTFASGTTSYTTSVGNAVTSLTVMPTVADITATVKVNGVLVNSGSASAPVSLNVGANTITVLVTAQDGTTKTYTVTVKRQSNNADLSNLSISSGPMDQTFVTATTSYTASVANAVSILTVTPTVADNTATVTVNGTSVPGGGANATVGLNVGANPITVLVTAQDGTTKTYTVTVTRAPSSNAELANLTLSSGLLDQTFASGTTSYTASVGNAVTSLTFTPTAADNTATVKVNGTSVTSGNASAPVSLNVGANTITVLVAAQDGTTTHSYTVIVTRAKSSNADLASLILAPGPLTPAFASGTTNYTTSVTNATYRLTVTPTVADSTATVTVNGKAVTGGGASAPISLAVGANTITVLVTAQDGTTTNTYTINVTRLSNNADLGNLSLSSGSLDPTFANTTTSYTTSVTNATYSLTVTPTVVDSTATVTIYGTAVTSGSASAPVSLSVGTNTITVIVAAQDGTTKTYTITVTRVPSSHADLATLTISAGTLTPSFANGTTSYTASVANEVSTLTLTPTVADSTSTVSINGTAATSGSASAPIRLNEGDNTITIVVAAQDGTTTKTYTVKVTRAFSPEPPTQGTDNTPGSDIFTIIINGQTKGNVATGTYTKNAGGETELTANLDTHKLEALVAQNDHSTVIIPASQANVKIVDAVLTADAAQIMQAHHALLELQTPMGTYFLPLSEVPTAALSSQLGGANLSDIKLHVTIAASAPATVQRLESVAAQDHFTEIAPPVEFTVSATYQDKSLPIETFSQYVKREIPLPQGQDPSKVTTAIVMDPNGGIHHVPTYVTHHDGNDYAVVNSLTNSTYTLIWHPASFADVDGHWAQQAVNDLASRMVVGGTDSTHFLPDAAITRAEFAAILIRGLGLAENGTGSSFTDVHSGDWYYGAVEKAKQYGLIDGYEDQTFHPMDTITREEAMVMIERAAKIAGLPGLATTVSPDAVLSVFADAAEVGTWAKAQVAAVVANGLVNGSNAGLLPQDKISRAETAAIVERMLVKAQLIQ